VPYDLKEPATRPESLLEGEQQITGLARAKLAQKPSMVVPDNDEQANIYYWKDLDRMAAKAGLPADKVLPFFLDADATPVPGGLPRGGVTVINLPNNHLQYAITWYGLALALVAVSLFAWLRRKS
jgi:surfeit locus 1 family protein